MNEVFQNDEEVRVIEAEPQSVETGEMSERGKQFFSKMAVEAER